jgi:hypothetical protein
MFNNKMISQSFPFQLHVSVSIGLGLLSLVVALNINLTKGRSMQKSPYAKPRLSTPGNSAAVCVNRNNSPSNFNS